MSLPVGIGLGLYASDGFDVVRRQAMEICTFDYEPLIPIERSERRLDMTHLSLVAEDFGALPANLNFALSHFVTAANALGDIKQGSLAAGDLKDDAEHDIVGRARVERVAFARTILASFVKAQRVSR